MKLLSFDLRGKMAHFRKYYSNSTALSYHVPPVATVKGMVAGMLGEERDSYYEAFSNEVCGIAVGVGAPLRKITQNMNLLKVESTNDLNGSKRPNNSDIYGANHVQNYTEWLIPENIREDSLCYPVRICFDDEHSETWQRLQDKLCRYTGFGYASEGVSLALGSAQCLGWIENARIVEAEERTVEHITTRFAVPVRQVSGLADRRSAVDLLKEESITDFERDGKAGRRITLGSKMDILISRNGEEVSYKFKQPTQIWYDGTDEFVFLRGDR